MYLGHVVSAAGVPPDPAKTEAVSSHPTPKDAKELRQFLGLSNYYRRFVANYSKIAEPLHKLLRKEDYPLQPFLPESIRYLEAKIGKSAYSVYSRFQIFASSSYCTQMPQMRPLEASLVNSRMIKNE